MITETDKKMMQRALQLATAGEGHVAPNPMVGAVITSPDGRIIGEGFHAKCGTGHAEVNAINSVKDEDLHLLPQSTMYVTLEPCAHFGKTPPCANLLIDKKIKRVVIASSDPNPKVAGKGIKLLKEASIEVETGVMAEEADRLNRRFMTFHSKKRPFIQLKWAQSADGYMAAPGNEQYIPVKFSNPLSGVFMHRQRALADAIMVGSNTVKIDSPRLDNRYWSGSSPVIISSNSAKSLQTVLTELYEKGITSLMVEGGAKLLNSFIKEGLYDEIRIEISPLILQKGLKAPLLPQDIVLSQHISCRDNSIFYFSKDESFIKDESINEQQQLWII